MSPRTLGVYLHVPFCLRKCLYCDFYSLAGESAGRQTAYAAALETELRARAPETGGATVTSVFFGGGTPSLLPIPLLARLTQAIRETYPVAPDAEWTIECNPATVDARGFAALRDAGFNRISLGIQSLDDAELAALGRVHNASDGLQALRDARAAGFRKINADLMFAIPGQTRASFARSLDGLLAEDPGHLSVYSLQIEEGTPFYRERDRLPLPDEEEESAMYALLCDRMRATGYRHYEISNFARPGDECRHNLRYWQMGDYLGVGPAAHSLLGDRRYQNRADLDAYLSDPLSVREDEETLDAAAREYETVMLALRTADGIDEAAFSDAFGHPFRATYEKRAAPYVAAGLAVFRDGRFALTERGMVLSTAVIGGLLDGEK